MDFVAVAVIANYVALRAAVPAVQYVRLPLILVNQVHAFGVGVVGPFTVFFENLCVKCIKFLVALQKIVSSAFFVRYV